MAPTRFQGKVAIVTGAASGIGRAVTHRVAGEGGRVAAIDIDAQGLEAVARAIQAGGGECLPFPCDISDPAQVEAAVAAAVQRFRQIDVLMNVAEICLEDDYLVEGVPEATWERTMGVNLMGPVYFCRYAIPEIVAAGGGAVVNISSVAALRLSERPAYASSQGALVSLTRCVARQYAADNVRANVICPGAVETDQAQNVRQYKPHPELQGRRPPAIMEYRSDPKEIAAVAAFLASDEASYITAAVYPVDGGQAVM
jgi:NAD(P)-dependent dehydrogenase (short-subunit alcohol dehydrogenase family)